ncbi:hypothetical protein CEXT_597311 [Caerostris extrusa]|uniref:Uncharacterized protein n=1 Tax=Caerostris extrusa TaxID=172846 RepID=A0AAV4Q7H7_CAEEX|nr:hypothetical protein CEXT_597311 [Caerostris extrusa]
MITQSSLSEFAIRAPEGSSPSPYPQPFAPRGHGAKKVRRINPDACSATKLNAATPGHFGKEIEEGQDFRNRDSSQ